MNKNLQIGIVLLLMIAITAVLTIKKHKNVIEEKQTPNWNQWSETEEKSEVAPIPEEPELKLEEPTSYKHALEIAKERNVNVFLFFESDNCVHCKRMKEQFSKPEVMKKLSNYVVYFCNVKDDKRITHKYKIYGVPAYFVISKNEEKIKSDVGFKDASSFIEWLGE